MTRVWRNQPVGNIEISLEQLQRKSRKFERTILWRNLREYTASAIVIATFAYCVWVIPGMLMRAGCVLVIAGTLFVAYTLHHKGYARTAPIEMAWQAYIEFHRSELIRQRDLLRAVWTWYLLPFFPGLAVFLIGLYRQTMKQPNAAAHSGTVALVFALSAVGCALVFWGIAKLNSWAARKIQREIDALDAAAEE